MLHCSCIPYVLLDVNVRALDIYILAVVVVGRLPVVTSSSPGGHHAHPGRTRPPGSSRPGAHHPHQVVEGRGRGLAQRLHHVGAACAVRRHDHALCLRRPERRGRQGLRALGDMVGGAEQAREQGAAFGRGRGKGGTEGQKAG